MTPEQLHAWLVENSEEDQWWISLDTVTEDNPVCVSEIESLLESGLYGEVFVLHVSQSNLENPPWIEVGVPIQQNYSESDPLPYDQIIKWQYASGLDDEWIVAVDGNASPHTKTLLDIKAIKDSAPKLKVSILNVCFRDDPNPEWIVYASQEELNEQMTPQEPVYYEEYNKFNATMEQMVSLAQKAILQNGNTVTSVGHGFVAFETGMTMSSFSGASCSISIEECEPFWFVVSGGGKSNVRGGQLVALDFGGAANKAKKVISTMKRMATG